MHILLPIIAVLSTFGSISFIFYTIFRARHIERMALIENGLDASIFKTHKRTSANFLKWGFILAFVGTGMFVGIFMDTIFDNDGPFFTFATLFMFGGIGLIAYYYSISKQNQSEKSLDTFPLESTQEIL